VPSQYRQWNGRNYKLLDIMRNKATARAKAEIYKTQYSGYFRVVPVMVNYRKKYAIYVSRF